MQKTLPPNQIGLHAGVLAALFISAVVLYMVPLQSASFYFDDRSTIVNDPAIRHIDIAKIFSAFNTRFLVGLSFALNYQLCGLHPFGYRIINIAIHSFNAFLVYMLVIATLQIRNWTLSIGRLTAFFASMLFLCHPLQTEAVNSITQRFVLMGTFFYLLALLMYIHYRRHGGIKFMGAAIFSAAAAMFCKEFTVTLPLMIVLWDVYFLPPLCQRWRKWLPFFAVALIVPFLLMKTSPDAVRSASIASTKDIHHVDITRANRSIGRKEYFLTELNVICTYVRLLLVPVNQNFDYDYPISRSMDGKTAVSALFLSCLLFLAQATYRSRRIISFSILWFFIALSIESGFIPIGHVIAEYRPYLACVGFTLLAAVLLYTRQMPLVKLNILAAIILIGFSFLTFERNNIWKDEFTLWNDTVIKSPHKARAYNNRGLEYYGKHDFPDAISDFTKAIEIKPDYPEAYSNRGVIYAQENDLPRAIADFNKAIELDPSYKAAYINKAKAMEYLRHVEK